jgi:hypothetical protein
MISATRRLSVSYWIEWRKRAKHFARMQRDRLESVQILDFFLIIRIRSDLLLVTSRINAGDLRAGCQVPPVA